MQLDLLKPEPLWAQQCQACGHRQRYIEHSCLSCGSYRVIGRSRADFDAHKAAVDAEGTRSKGARHAR